MPAPPPPRGRLRWFGRARFTGEDGQQDERPAAVVDFENTAAQQQFVNSGVMGLELEDDTVAYVLDHKPDPPPTA
jgi:hypothetical protein